MIALSSCIVIYYNVLNCWSLYFLVTSFSDPGIPTSGSNNITFLNNAFVYLKNVTQLDPEVRSWSDFGELQWHLVLCMMATWVIIALALAKGIQYSTYLVYFTAIYPFLYLVSLWIFSFTLQGWDRGVWHFWSWHWDEVFTIKVNILIPSS